MSDWLQYYCKLLLLFMSRKHDTRFAKDHVNYSGVSLIITRVSIYNITMSPLPRAAALSTPPRPF